MKHCVIHNETLHNPQYWSFITNDCCFHGERFQNVVINFRHHHKNSSCSSTHVFTSHKIITVLNSYILWKQNQLNIYYSDSLRQYFCFYKLVMTSRSLLNVLEILKNLTWISVWRAEVIHVCQFVMIILSFICRSLFFVPCGKKTKSNVLGSVWVQKQDPWVGNKPDD